MNSKGILLASVIALASCQSIDTNISAAVPKGFLCSASPSEAYSPGFVYRVDNAGISSMVMDLSAEAKTSLFKAALASYEASAVTGGDLSVALSESPVNGSASVSSSRTSKTVFSEGNFAFMSDSDEEALIDEIRSRVTPRADNRYFLVRDAIQAKGIEISLSSSDEAKLGGEAKIRSLLSVRPSVSITRTQSLVVSDNFDPALNVCVRAIELTLSTDSEPVLVNEMPKQDLILSPEYLATLLSSL